MAAVLTKRKLGKELPPDPAPDNDGSEIGPLSSELDPPADPTPLSSVDDPKNIPEPSTKKLASYKNSRLSPKVWFKLVEGVEKGYWENLIIYVYRIMPKIMRKKSNPANPSNIGSYGQPVSEEGLLKAHGWGWYKLILSDTTRKDERCVAWTLYKAECGFDECPPILNYAELDTDYPENRNYVNYLKLQGKLNADGMPIEGSNMSQPIAGTDPALLSFMERMFTRLGDSGKNNRSDTEAQAITKAIDIVGKGGERVAEMVTKNSDPLMMIKLFEAIQPKGNGNDVILQMMHEDVKRLQDQNNQLMMKLIDKPAPPDPIENLLKYKELFNSMQGEQGEAPSRNWKEKLVDALPQMAGPVLNIIAAALQGRATGQRIQVNPVTGMPAESPMGPVQEAPRALDAPQVTESPIPTQQELISAQIRQYGMFIVQAVARGEQGDAFAQSLETMFGVESGVYPTIASLGKEGIIGALKSEPGTWQRLAPMEARLEKFVDEFLEFGKPGEEGETE